MQKVLIGWLTILTVIILVIGWLVLQGLQRPQYQPSRADTPEPQVTPTGTAPRPDTVVQLDLGYLDGNSFGTATKISVPILIENTEQSISAFGLQFEFVGMVPDSVNFEVDSSLNQQMRAEGWTFPVLNYADGVMQIAGIYLEPQGYVFNGTSEMSTAYMFSFVIKAPGEGEIRMNTDQSKVMSKTTAENVLSAENKSVWAYAVSDDVTPTPTPTEDPTVSPSVSPTAAPSGTVSVSPTPDPGPMVKRNFQFKLQGISDTTGLQTPVHILIFEQAKLYPNDPVFSAPVVLRGMEGTDIWQTANPLGDLSPGTEYHLYITSNKHLMRDMGVFGVSESEETIPLTDKILLAGDSNADNLLTIEDLGAIISVYDELSITSEEGLRYDYNLDGELTIVDIAIVLSNYTDLRVEGDARELYYLLSEQFGSQDTSDVRWPGLKFLEERLRGWTRGS